MTGKEYQELAIRTCSIPYDQKEDRLFHAVFGLNSEAGEVAVLIETLWNVKTKKSYTENRKYPY